MALTVLTYHYVRELNLTRNAGLHGLNRSDFEGQIAYLAKHYTFISVEAYLSHLYDLEPVPSNSVLLTFDDGYLDHFTNVLPVLEHFEAKGAFFVPVRSARDRRVLDVNKFHFVLDAANSSVLIEDLRHFVDVNSEVAELLPWDDYKSRWAIANQFDDADTRFLKNMLQRGLPLELRHAAIDELYQAHVDLPEPVLAEELYMRPDQLRALLKWGHHVGAHGDRHVWLNDIDHDMLVQELRSSRQFLEELGVGADRLTIGYPYGGVNREVCEMARAAGFHLGFTVEEGIVQSDSEPMALPRLDTNSFPTQREAVPCAWTERARAHD